MSPEVDSASENEYQGISPGVKAAGAYGWRPTTLVVPEVEKIRGLNLPGTPCATLACCGISSLYRLSLSGDGSHVIRNMLEYDFLNVTDEMQLLQKFHLVGHVKEFIFNDARSYECKMLRVIFNVCLLDFYVTRF
jgi:hypothetical protein